MDNWWLHLDHKWGNQVQAVTFSKKIHHIKENYLLKELLKTQNLYNEIKIYKKIEERMKKN